MSAPLISWNGIDTYKLKSWNGSEKQTLDSLSGTDLSPPPVVFLTFEEGSGGTTEDLSESGTDHDATIPDTGSWSSTYKAAGTYSIVLNANWEGARCADHADLDWPVGTSWTISAYLATTSTSYVGVYVKRDTSGNGYTGPAVFMNAGELEIYLVDTWGSEACHLVPTATSTNIREAGVYHNVVVTYDGSSNGDSSGFTGYVDGVKHTVANGRLQVGAGGDNLDALSAVTNSKLAHWGDDSATGTLYSGGTDHCAAWKGVHITDAQAAKLYNSGTPIDVRRGL